MPMALMMKLGPSTSVWLDAEITATLPSNRTGPSTEFTAAVRLRRSRRISAEASASTRRRALPRAPRSFGVVSTAGRVAVISNSLTAGSCGGGDGAVGDGEECLLEGGGTGLQAGELQTVLARPGQQRGQGRLQVVGAQLDVGWSDGDRDPVQVGQLERGVVHDEADSGRLAGGALGLCAGEHDPAGAHHRDPIGELPGLLEVMGGQDDGGAASDQVPDQLPDRAADLRVQPGGGLVEDDDPWPAEQRQGEVEPAPLAAGEAAHPDAGAGAEVDGGQRLGDRARPAEGARPGVQRLTDGE